MPVSSVRGAYESPFYRDVDGFVRAELNTRGQFHGQRVRGARAPTPGTGGGDAARNLNWSYGKKPWCRIRSAVTGIVLGTAGTRVMSDRTGNLTMYSAARNVPSMPLLQSLDVSNEGTMGSLLKGKFTFTIYPRITTSGFILDNIEDAFFTPGAEVNIAWGWSVHANNSQACRGKFTGIIYNFNWSVNPDLSLTADCSVVSASTIATGMSGDVSTGSDPGSAPVTVGTNPLPGPNIASVIDKDMADPAGGFAATVSLAPFTSAYILRTATNMQMLEYAAIGLPFQEVEPEGTGNTDPAVRTQGAAQIVAAPPTVPPIPKPFYYVKYLFIVEFINFAINQLETGLTATPAGVNDTMGRLFTVKVQGNFTAWVDQIRSAFPIDIYFPDDVMGEYGGSSPFTPGFLRDPAGGAISPPGVGFAQNISIGAILIGTDFIKKTYKEFVSDNAANISHKNLTSFFETISKRINYASGDVYQITPVLYEDENLSNAGATAAAAGVPVRAILSIEDTNLTREVINLVTPYEFRPNIFQAIMRNASITCKPPAASAAAAYTAARGQQRGANQPTNSDVKLSPTSGPGAAPPSPQMTANARNAVDPAEGLPAKILNAPTDGFNNAWGEAFRGLITKWKKNLETSTTGGANGNGHWMNKAVYPIDLTITIDGVMGFKFGDAIECFAIPARYNQDPWNVSFTVTKVSHKIDAGAWTTTLNTKARVNMGG